MTLRATPIVLLTALAAAQQPKLTAEKLFDPNHVVDVKIEIAKADWDTLRLQSRSFLQSLQKEPPKRSFTYFKANVVVDGVRIENVGVRKKGLVGSLDTTRPSLKIKFAEYQKQQPAVGLDRLTLNNNKQDRSQISQYLGYKMFRDAGGPACRCNFAKVSVNGESLGVYSNVESIKPPMLKHAFGDDGSGMLFEGTVADFFPGWEQKFAEKNAKSDHKVMVPITKIFAEDDIDLVALEKHLDVDAFLRFWATESLIGFWDGYSNNQNNFFVYRKPANKKLYFMPWGLDSAFVSSMPVPPYIIQHRTAQSQAMLCNMLYRIPEVRQRYRKIFEGMMEQLWDVDVLQKEIDRVSAMVRDHVHDLQGGAKAQATHARVMKRFVKNRKKVLGRELKKWPLNMRNGPRAPMWFEGIGKATGTFDTTYTHSAAKNPYTNGKATAEILLNGKTVTLSRVGVSGERSNWPTIDGGPKPPSLIFHARRAKDDKLLILAISPAIDDFRPSGEHAVPVMGALIEGAFGFLKPDGFIMVSGTMKFEAAEMKKGTPLKGSFSVELARMHGGKPIDLDK